MNHKDRSQSRGPVARGHFGKGGNGGCHGGRGGPLGHGGVPVLTYFDGEGLAEQVRLAFTVGGVKFVDRRVKDHAEFEAKLKAYTPHGQLPILEVDGETIVQSAAIMAYAARRAGLEPENAIDRDRARSLQSMLVELMSVGESFSSSIPVTERRTLIFEALGKKLPVIAERIESTISPSANGWLFGDSISYVDIAVHCAIRSWKVYVPGAVDGLETKYPKMMAVHDAVEKHSAIQKYRAEKSAFKPKLYYFNADGLAAPIRWAFEIGGVEYEDIRMTQEEWPAIKPKIPAGTVPALEIAEGEFLSESLAVLVHVARKTGLVPCKESHFAHAYSVGLTLAVISPILRTIYAAESDEQKAANLKIANEETLPALLTRLEAVVGLKQSKQGYIVGDRLSFADLMVTNIFNMLGQRLMGINVADLWTKYPNCKKVYNLVINHPVVADHLLRSPVVTPKLIYFDIAARAEVIRQIFKYANVEFEDTRLALNDWRESYKAQAVTGKAPYLDIGTDRIYETLGCVMYAAERAHLIPRSWKARSQAMALFSVYNNTIDVRSRQYAGQTDSERATIREKNKPDYEAQHDIFEKLLGTSQSIEGYAVGGELSWIDFYIAYETDFMTGSTGYLSEDWAEKYPNTAKLHKLVIALRK